MKYIKQKLSVGESVIFDNKELKVATILGDQKMVYVDDKRAYEKPEIRVKFKHCDKSLKNNTIYIADHYQAQGE